MNADADGNANAEMAMLRFPNGPQHTQGVEANIHDVAITPVVEILIIVNWIDRGKNKRPALSNQKLRKPRMWCLIPLVF